MKRVVKDYLCAPAMMVGLERIRDLDLILIGMSSEYLDKRDSLISLMNKSHLNFEIMELGAVCRTYNVLMAEGRRVAAILTQY